MLTTDYTFSADGAAGTKAGFSTVKQVPMMFEKFPRDNPDFSVIIPRVVTANAQAVAVIGSPNNTDKALKRFAPPYSAPRS